MAKFVLCSKHEYTILTTDGRIFIIQPIKIIITDKLENLPLMFLERSNSIPASLRNSGFKKLTWPLKK